MAPDELNPSNYRRISYINWVITLPLAILFAWPYLYLGRLAGIESWALYPGSILFAAPFVLTILHGHATLALGSLHRGRYYEWLEHKPLTFGLLFHPVLASTRLRLALLVVSVVIFLVTWAI
ncbi:MAG: hypothetical protein U5K31_05795 [Balneolaceae bacterium]|nr:hypothetical protein [Balneolaceae bacterium]